MQHVGEELSQIIQQVQTLTPNFETVSEGMESQSLEAQQTSDSLAQLSESPGAMAFATGPQLIGVLLGRMMEFTAHYLEEIGDYIESRWIGDHRVCRLEPL